MDQTIKPERTVTTQNLRMLSKTVIQHLISGHGFTLLHEGRPLAHLLPLVPASTLPQAAQPLVTSSRLERLETFFGRTDLARVLGLSLTTFLARRMGLQYSGNTLGRLEVISEVVGDLMSSLSAAQAKAWFSRPSKELQGRTPLTTLAFPWVKDDATITLIHHLARRELVKPLISPHTPARLRQ